MSQPGAPMKQESATEAEPLSQPPRDPVGEVLDRLSYAIGLGTVMFIVVAIPALFWPRELGNYLNGYTYVGVLVIAYFCVPLARRYMPRIK